MTLEDSVNDFLVEQQIRGNSDRTVLYYRRCLGFFLEYLKNPKMEVSAVTLKDCQGYYLYLKRRDISSVTVQTYIRAVRSFLSWCYHEGYIENNLTERFRLPKAQRKEIDVLTDSEIQRLFSCFDCHTLIGARNYCICALMLDSGLRLNEVVTLETDKVHLPEGYVIVNGKGNKQRIVPIGLHTKRAILQYRSRVPEECMRTLLFVKDTLCPLEITTVKQLFRKLKKRADIPRLRPHLLRHTFATRYLENGGDIYSLQHILGHTSLEMVKKYVHLTDRKMSVYFPQYSPLDNLLKR